MWARLSRTVLDSALFQVALLVWCLAIFAIYFGLAGPLAAWWFETPAPNRAQVDAFGLAAIFIMAWPVLGFFAWTHWEQRESGGTMRSRTIRIAAAVVLGDGGRTLLVRKRGTAAFMQAGGKLGDDEAPLDALRREIREELGCGLSGTPVALGRFTAPAVNEAGCTVEAEMFAVTLAGEIRPAAEIEDAIWHDPDDLESIILAPLTRDHALPLARDLGRGK